MRMMFMSRYYRSLTIVHVEILADCTDADNSVIKHTDQATSHAIAASGLPRT